jgi:putative ABC transport system substrate-binding protein
MARAQQSAMPVVGFLSARAPGESMNLVSAFRQGLRAAGFIEGQNVIIAFRWAESHSDRLPTLAKELIDLRVAVLFAAGGSTAAFAAKTATQTIPVVFSAVSDPVGVGLVASLNRPGGNVTGMSFTTPEMVAKSTQLLKELVPGAGMIAYLVNPSAPSAELYRKEAERDAAALGIKIRVLNASTARDLDQDFASLTQIGAGGLVVPADSLSTRSDCGALGTLSDGGHIDGSGIRPDRRPNELRTEPARFLSTSRHLCRPHTQGRQAGRPAGNATREVRIGHQPENRQDARSYRSR